MQHTLSCPPYGSSNSEDNSSFDVVIAYEDFETGKHARKTYEFLVENLGHDCRFTNQMWKFDVLRIPKLREMAAKDAADADIIIVSSHGDDDLPAEVKQWIDMWVGERGNALALVALFDRAEDRREKARSVRAYLAQVARQGRMEFFAQPDDWPGRRGESDPFLIQPHSGIGGRTLSTLAGAIQREPSLSHWGINE
jgi:hypothetical protein